MDLDRWLNDNNPGEQLQYSKGWWNYIELIRRLMYKFGAKEAQVVTTYPMRTPPPEKISWCPRCNLRLDPRNSSSNMILAFARSAGQ